MDLTEKQKQILENIAYELNGEIYENYSGRFMYNKTCLGITVKTLEKSLFKLGQLSAEKDFPELGRFEVDNLGRGFIIYFPRIEG